MNTPNPPLGTPLILIVTVIVVRVYRGQYREELILNVTVIFVRVWHWEI